MQRHTVQLVAAIVVLLAFLGIVLSDGPVQGALLWVQGIALGVQFGSMIRFKDDVEPALQTELLEEGKLTEDFDATGTVMFNSGPKNAEDIGVDVKLPWNGKIVSLHVITDTPWPDCDIHKMYLTLDRSGYVFIHESEPFYVKKDDTWVSPNKWWVGYCTGPEKAHPTPFDNSCWKLTDLIVWSA